MALNSEAGQILRGQIFSLSITTAQDLCRYQIRILVPIIREVMRNAMAADHGVGGDMQTFWNELKGKSSFNDSRQTLVDKIIGGIAMVTFHQI